MTTEETRASNPSTWSKNRIIHRRSAVRRWPDEAAEPPGGAAARPVRLPKAASGEVAGRVAQTAQPSGANNTEVPCRSSPKR